VETTSGGVSGGSATVTLSLDIALPGRTMDLLRLALELDQSTPIVICEGGYSKPKKVASALFSAAFWPTILASPNRWRSTGLIIDVHNL
jgi:hypothetical protein